MTDCENAGYSPKKNRIYCRKFNFAEARERHAAGETMASLQREYGVTHNALRRALDPEFRKKFDAKSSEFVRTKYRAPCKGGCGTMIWTHGTRDRSGYCRLCLAIVNCKTAREGELLCGRCGEWKPDQDFPKQASAKARRLHASLCRPCQTLDRQERRERGKVPCAKCGNLCLPRSERMSKAKALGYEPTDLCAACWHRELGIQSHARSLT